LAKNKTKTSKHGEKRPINFEALATKIELLMSSRPTDPA